MKIVRGEDEGNITTVGIERFLCQRCCCSQVSEYPKVPRRDQLAPSFGTGDLRTV